MIFRPLTKNTTPESKTLMTRITLTHNQIRVILATFCFAEGFEGQVIGSFPQLSEE